MLLFPAIQSLFLKEALERGRPAAAVAADATVTATGTTDTDATSIATGAANAAVVAVSSTSSSTAISNATIFVVAAVTITATASVGGVSCRFLQRPTKLLLRVAVRQKDFGTFDFRCDFHFSPMVLPVHMLRLDVARFVRDTDRIQLHVFPSDRQPQLTIKEVLRFDLSLVISNDYGPERYGFFVASLAAGIAAVVAITGGGGGCGGSCSAGRSLRGFGASTTHAIPAMINFPHPL